MPLPEDEAQWETLDVMFATTGGTVRRNKLSDFAQVNRAGKIAMKLDAGEEIVDVQICTENDDVLLTTANGQCIRFPVTDVRVFKGRNSMGVRGIALAKATGSSRSPSCAISRRRAASARPISRCAVPSLARRRRPAKPLKTSEWRGGAQRSPPSAMPQCRRRKKSS